MSKRDMYVAQLKAQLDIWNAQLSKLEAQGREVGASAKDAYEMQVQLLQAQGEQVKARLDEIQTANEDAWEDLKTGADSAWGALRDSMEKAISRFK